MKTKKALAGLLGLLGSLAAFPFFAGFLATLFFTESLSQIQNIESITGMEKQTTDQNRSKQRISKERKKNIETYLESAFALDLPPFMTELARKQRKPVRIAQESVKTGVSRLSRRPNEHRGLP